jgi:hypothetical protein
MIQRDSFVARAPFQGDHAFRLRSIPAGAQILKVVAKVVPIGGPDFIQEISFGKNGETFGATRTPTNDWVEIDFHARRTLVSVTGSALKDASLQADFGGGIYVNISRTGAFQGPPDPPFTTADLGGPLPGLAVSKFKLTRAASSSAKPEIDAVTIRNTPANISLGLGKLGAFWTHLGDMTAAEATPDFAAILQAFLSRAPIENGYYLVPLILHSDSLARLFVSVETELVGQQSAIGAGLTDVVLPFDLSGLAQPQADVLQVKIPRNARIVPEQTAARVKGAFEETRIAYEPAVEGETEVEVSPIFGQAQSVSLDAPASAVAVDLLIKAVGGGARLRLDLRPDLAGKPDNRSLLSRPAELAIDPRADDSASWISVPLPEEFRFLGSIPYWVVLQSLEGTLHWKAGRAPFPRLGMQRTEDGGLSWRLATPLPASGIVLSSAPAGALAGLFRLRSKPKNFQVPIAIEAGGPAATSRVPLNRFAPLGRVDFSPNQELAQAVGESLAQSTSGDPPSCPEGEHLANADFTQWFESTKDESELPTEWSLGGGTITPVKSSSEEATSIGHHLGVLMGEIQSGPNAGARLKGLQGNDEPAPAALSQVVPVVPSCPYQFSFHALAEGTGAVGELSWRNSLGEFQRVDMVPITARVEPPTGVAPPAPVRAPEHRIRVNAPDGAVQAEVRFRVPAGGMADIIDASLEVTGNRLDNFNLQALDKNLPAGWTLKPSAADKVLVEVRANLAVVANAGTAAAELIQNLPVNAGEAFLFEFDGSVVGSEAAPRIELHYLTADGPPAADAIVLNLSTDDSLYVPAGGTVPEQVTRAEVHLVLPARTAMGVRSLSLQLSKPAAVPIAFIAEAPGELKVSELRVAYDRVPVPPPPVPPEGLRPPTPADQEAGEEPDGDSYCGHCGARKSLRNAGVSRTPAGRPTVVGDCRNCGAKLVSMGGRPVMPHEVERSFPATSASFPKPVLALASIVGIGKSRESGLIRAGIDSLEKLAAAEPADVAHAMIGVGVRNAPHFIAEARKLVEARHLAEQKSNPWSNLYWS